MLNRKWFHWNKYIGEFFCNELRLIIEIYSISHMEKRNYDKKMDNHQKRLGFSILHFNRFFIDKDIKRSYCCNKKNVKHINLI